MVTELKDEKFWSIMSNTFETLIKINKIAFLLSFSVTDVPIHL